MKKNDPRFYVDCKRPAAIISMIAFALAVPFRIIGYADKITEPIYGITQVLLPVLCSVLMIAVLIKKRKGRPVAFRDPCRAGRDILYV